MSDKIFTDSNVLVYLAENDMEKKTIAASILANRPFISTQVINLLYL